MTPFTRKFILLTVAIATFFSSNAEERIKMTQEGGVYTMPCEVNGLRMRFIFDTGAAKVSLSLTEALFMLKKGYINEDDIIGSVKTRVANGSIEDNAIIRLREVKVGSKTIKNVEAVVSKSVTAPLLLGQSAIERLGEWSIVGEFLVIKDQNDVKKSSVQSDYDEEYISTLIASAEEGDVESQLELAFSYEVGDNAPQSYEQAVYWYKKAAEQGNADAQNNLGASYYNGQGVARNYQKAIYWYKKAAEQGNAFAQGNLGKCYYNGNGAAQNYKQAVFWLKKAAEQGYADAQNHLGVCYENGNGVTQSYEEAVYWYQKAAEQGNAVAQNNLGICYANGDGVEQGYQEAVYWYKKAAEQGDSDAQYNLGVHYYNGEGVPQSNREAAHWFRKAAAQGDRDAQIMLEKIGYTKSGTKKAAKKR